MTDSTPIRRNPSAYQAPSIAEYGSLEEMTAGAAAGEFLDATFPTGTDFDLLTFT